MKKQKFEYIQYSQQQYIHDNLTKKSHKKQSMVQKYNVQYYVPFDYYFYTGEYGKKDDTLCKYIL